MSLRLLIQIISALFFIDISYVVSTKLVVNIKTQSGEVFQENILANNTNNWVSIEYRQPADDSYIMQLIDFKNDLQIIHIVRLGEEELGQKPFQEMCFISSFNKEDYISADAMSKLRQKNPWTLRSPEEDKGMETLDVDLSLDVTAAGSLLSPHIPILCEAATSTTFASSRDLKAWINDRQADSDSDWAALTDASHQQPSKGVSLCDSTSDNLLPCICQQQVCLWWYPCGLKFCKDRDDSGKSVSYRCGIRTCRRCHMFAFYATAKNACLH